MTDPRTDDVRTTQADTDPGGGVGSPPGRPEREPGAAILRDDAPAPGPQAPSDRAPEMDGINPGDGPGATPGE